MKKVSIALTVVAALLAPITASAALNMTTVNILNKNLVKYDGLEIDEITKVVTMRVDTTTLNVKMVLDSDSQLYELAGWHDGLDTDSKIFLDNANVKKACYGRNEILAMGVNVRYEYVDNEGIYLHGKTVTLADCNK